MNSITKDLKNKDEERRDEKVIDPKAIRLQDLPMHMSEAEIREVVERKYGKIDRVKIPEDDRGRNKGFAIIGFANQQSAKKAIEDEDVTIGSACLSIAVAFQSQRPPRDGGDRSAFNMLKRR